MKKKKWVLIISFIFLFLGLHFLMSEIKYNISNKPIYHIDRAKELIRQSRPGHFGFHAIKTAKNKALIYIVLEGRPSTAHGLTISKTFNISDTTFIVVRETNNGIGGDMLWTPTLMEELEVKNKIVVLNTEGRFFRVSKTTEKQLEERWENR